MNNLINTVICFMILCIFESSLGLEYNKPQKYNPSLDFLAHEAGLNSNLPKKDYVAPTNNDYNIQFPSLGSSTTHTTAKPSTVASTLTTPKPATGLRDYVAPQPKTPTGNRDSIAPQNRNQNAQGTQIPSGKRDYVAPKSPTPKPHSMVNHDNIASQPPTQKPLTTSGRRDYVAPQFTTQKSVQGNSKVKDLINFYDSKTGDQNGPQRNPNYSSIVSGNKPTTNVNPVTQPASKPTANTMKPLSFSSVVSGSTKPGSPPGTTPKPFTSQGHGSLNPSRPGSPALPSSIVNNNKNNNQGNTNSPTDAELQTVSEELLRKDTNNAAKYLTVNYQQKTTSQSSEDKAPLPLITASPEAWNIPTVQKLLPLLDNYERDTLINEHVTAQERNEENAFMDAIMSTQVMRHLMSFLKEKGYVSPDPKQQRDFMKQLWFNLYSRGKGKISSSGFEHVFVSELKNGDVQGLHNWIYFSKEELANRLNYLGYLKYLQLDDKGSVMKLHFNQQGVDKPVGTMFVGTSPELEMALYTLCFVTRADNDCNLKLATKDVGIVSHTFRYRSKNYIGSAYPRI